jgi:hypothetical protein
MSIDAARHVDSEAKLYLQVERIEFRGKKSSEQENYGYVMCER